MSSHRVFVIGIDGATWGILEPLISGGHMPNLARLRAGGVWGELASTFIHASAPAWATFMTGVNPGKHGVFYFQAPWREGHQRRILDSRDIQSPALWTLASQAGRRVAVVNVPLTYPPHVVNGVMISGMLLAPLAMSERMTYPDSLYQELRSTIGDFGLTIRSAEFKSLAPEEFLDQLTTTVKQRTRIVQYLMDRQAWDLFIAVFDSTDRLQHYLWQYMDPAHRFYDPARAAELRPRIEGFFHLLDDAIGQIEAALPEDTTLIVLSDHGFGPCNHRIYMNHWLQEIGLLHLRPTKASSGWRRMVRRWVECLDVFGLRHRLPVRARSLLTANPYLRVDWSRTVAYSATATELGFFVNLRGREPFGCVAPGDEYEAVRDQLINALADLRHPTSGEPLIDRAYRREEVFTGPYVDQAPDVLYTFREPADIMPKTDLDTGRLFGPIEPPESGSHRRSGIIVLHGPRLDQSVGLEGASIADIAPTILHLLSVPIPHHMDGRVLPPIQGEAPIHTSQVIFDRVAHEDTYSAADQEAIRDRLRSLGYLD